MHFQERPWDLFVTLGYTVAMTTVLLVLEVGNLFAILLVVFAPGYVLVAALFPGSIRPGHPGIDWGERLALSFDGAPKTLPAHPQ